MHCHCLFMLVNTLTNVNKWHLIVKLPFFFNCAIYETHYHFPWCKKKRKRRMLNYPLCQKQVTLLYCKKNYLIRNQHILKVINIYNIRVCVQYLFAYTYCMCVYSYVHIYLDTGTICIILAVDHNIFKWQLYNEYGLKCISRCFST